MVHISLKLPTPHLILIMHIDPQATHAPINSVGGGSETEDTDVDAVRVREEKGRKCVVDSEVGGGHAEGRRGDLLGMDDRGADGDWGDRQAGAPQGQLVVLWFLVEDDFGDGGPRGDGFGQHDI